MEEKVIRKMVLGRPGFLAAMICFGVAILGIVVNLIVMAARGDSFVKMFIYIGYGYWGGFALFLVGLILGILFLFKPAGELVLTNKRIYLSFKRKSLLFGTFRSERSIKLDKINLYQYQTQRNRRSLLVVSNGSKINVVYRNDDEFYKAFLEQIG